MNQKKARLLRKFAKKTRLWLPAIKQTYYSLPRTKRHAFSQELQSVLAQ